MLQTTTYTAHVMSVHASLVAVSVDCLCEYETAGENHITATTELPQSGILQLQSRAWGGRAPRDPSSRGGGVGTAQQSPASKGEGPQMGGGVEEPVRDRGQLAGGQVGDGRRPLRVQVSSYPRPDPRPPHTTSPPSVFQ